MPNRTRARECALQILYQMELTATKDVEVAIKKFSKNFETQDADLVFLGNLVQGVTDQMAKIDAQISANSHNWKLPRLAAIDRNILRIGIYELLFSPDLPRSVVINEAVEISKKFGSDNSAPFVNGVLDAIHEDPVS